ncbi:hypothetical protein SSX86_016009 [Deinandra increscens subsp. villosa]|uniref:Uncharacterized protein n=1 Tax=Deinandra increscens subsp. villosa TaxID=3103831 RepID=A0AAP0D1X6_9ASTR
MNHYGIHQKNTFASSSEEMRRSVSVSVISDNGAPMVCPKPRRLSLFSTTINEPVRPLRWQMCHPSEGHDSAAGLELLDTIFAKCGGYGPPEQICTQLASSPPFFSGSPPSRVSNPLIQDTRFGDDKICPNVTAFDGPQSRINRSEIVSGDGWIPSFQFWQQTGCSGRGVRLS